MWGDKGRDAYANANMRLGAEGGGFCSIGSFWCFGRNENKRNGGSVIFFEKIIQSILSI